MDFKLRSREFSDKHSLAQYANNFEIAKFMTDRFPHPYTMEDAEEFIAFAKNGHPIHIFAIDINGEAVGGIGVHPQSDIHRKNAELGYWLGEPFWRKNIITKAIQKIVDVAFETYDINRIFARPFGTNVASQRALEKAGFKLEGKFEKTYFKNGEFLDELIYARRR